MKIMIKKIKRLFDQMNFKKKIFLYMIVFSIPLLLCISGIIYHYVSDWMEEQTTQQMYNVMNETVTNLNFIVNDSENISRSILSNDDVQQLMKESRIGTQYLSLNRVSDFIYQSINYRSYISCIVLANQNGTVFSTDMGDLNIGLPGSMYEKWWYSGLNRTEQPYVWVPQATQNKYSNQNADNTVMLTRKITNISDYKTQLGNMMIYLNSSYISNLLNETQYGNDVDIWVVDSSGRELFKKTGGNHPEDIIATANRRISSIPVGKKCFIDDIDGSTYLLGSMPFHIKEDWYIVCAVPYSKVSLNLIMMQNQILLMVTLFLFISLITSFIVATSIANPINRLASSMDKYGTISAGSENHVKRTSDENRNDEIGRINRSYISLTRRIESLIQENYVKDLEKKSAEMASLESQIKPHFLYNTLDSINWLAMSNGQDKISEMITALADCFRLSLHKTDNAYIRLEDEIQHVRSYLTIQEYRYGEQLTCRYAIDKSVKELYTPRFILQPLVENALKHGIDKLSGNGEIKISACVEAGRLVIQIINDGIGIDLIRIKSNLSSNGITGIIPQKERDCYGISNINSRIQILCGEEFGLNYHQLNNGKIVCSVILPVVFTDNGYKKEDTKKNV